jgi:hypothetical protein
MSNPLNALFPRRQLQDLRYQLDQRGALVNQLESQLAELRRNMTELSTRHQEALGIIDDLEADLEEARARHETLEADARATRSLLEGESAALRGKDEELTAERKARERLEAEQREHVARVLDLKVALQQAETSAVSERQARKRAEAELRERIDRSLNLKATLQQAETQAATERQARERAEIELREHTEKLVALRLSLERMHAEFLGERRMRKDREEDLRALRETLARQVEEKADLERRIGDLTRQHGELSEAIRTVSVQLDAAAGEREGSAALRAALDRETAEKARLALELAHNPMRLKLAAMEEALHIHLAQALDLSEPVIRAEGNEAEAVEKFTQLALEKAAEAGGIRVSRGRKSAKSSAMTPDKFAAYRANYQNAWAIAIDNSPSTQDAIAAASPGAAVLSLSDVQLRFAASFPLDPAATFPTMSPDEAPKRVIVVACADEAMADSAAASIASLAAGRSLPRLPSALVKAGALDVDAWLATALAAAGNPRVVVLRLDAEAIAAIATEAASGRAAAFKNLLLRARVLTLVWSDKTLGAAWRQTYGAGKQGGALDEGDARMSVPTYRELVREDRRMAGLIANSGVFKSADVVKAFIELTDAFALVQFCRDAGFALKPARAGETPDLFAPAENTRASEFAKLIRAAVEDQAARSPEDGAGGLKALARALERAGRYADAFDTLAEAMRTMPSDFEVRREFATYLELSGRDAAAERTLRDGLRHSEMVTAAVEALRDHYRRTGDSHKAYAAARLWRRTGAPQGALAVAAGAIALGKTSEARRALAPAVEAHRSGGALERVQRLVSLRESLDELRAAAEGGGAEQWFAFGEALRQLNEVAEAAKAYKRAEADAPGFLARACGSGIGPDLLLIGPPRTATTLLRKVLDLSPSVALLDGESSFLTNDWPMPMASFLDNIRQARTKKGASLIGDKSPMHFTIDSAHIALAALLFPQARIVITTREPVKRAWSEIKLFGHRRVVDANIAAALGGGALPRWLAAMIENSRYFRHAKLWTEHFGRDRVLLLQSEDFERNVLGNCARLFDWLALEHPSAADIERLQRNWSNRTASYALDPALAALLEKTCGAEMYKVRDLEAALAVDYRRNPAA